MSGEIMRFKVGELISEDAFWTDESPLYLVVNCNESHVLVMNISDDSVDWRGLRGMDNFACFNEHGTIQELIKKQLFKDNNIKGMITIVDEHKEREKSYIKIIAELNNQANLFERKSHEKQQVIAELQAQLEDFQ